MFLQLCVILCTFIKVVVHSVKSVNNCEQMPINRGIIDYYYRVARFGAKSVVLVVKMAKNCCGCIQVAGRPLVTNNSDGEPLSFGG